MRTERRYAQGRLNRRQALRTAAVAGSGLAAGLLTACRSEERPAADRPAVKEPKRGGIINYGGGSGDVRARGLDPHVSSPQYSMTYRLVYQGLLGYDLRTYDVEPELAHQWEQPSQTEYVLILQPGVRWQNKPPVNGRPLIIEDVVFSLDRMRTNDPRFFTRSLLETVDKSEMIDTERLRLTTKTPDASFLMKLSADPAMVLAPEVVERAGKFTTADAMVGTGPFLMKSVEDYLTAEYVRNPDYWKPGLPYLDGIRTKYFEDDKLSYAAFLGGELDITRVPGDEVKKYLARQGPDYSPEWFEYQQMVCIQANTKAKPMDDPRVTRALRLLIDHQEQNAHGTLMHGRARHGSIFATSLSRWDLTDEEYEKHLEWKPNKGEAVRMALDLLRAAGFTKENPLRFEMITFDTGVNLITAQLVEAQFRRLSQGVVDLRLKPIDSPSQTRVRAERTFTYAYLGNAGATNDPDAWLTQLYRSGGSRNYQEFSDAKLDAMIDAQRSIFNLEQRRARVREIVTYMIDHAPGTVPFNWYALNAVNPKIRNFAPEFWLHGRQYEQVWVET